MFTYLNKFFTDDDLSDTIHTSDKCIYLFCIMYVRTSFYRLVMLVFDEIIRDLSGCLEK